MPDWADSAADDADTPKPAVPEVIADVEEREPLPEIEVRGPDPMGNKIIIEWSYNEEGEKVKTTTKMKVTQRACKVKKAVLDRRPVSEGGQARLFGKAVTQGNGGGITRIDSVCTITQTAAVNADKVKKAFEEAWKQKKQASAQKWGTRDYSKPKGDGDEFWTKVRNDYYGEGEAPAGGGGLDGDKMKSQGGANAYKAPARREGASSRMTEGDRFGRPGGDVATVRITNLSEEATDEDVKQLCMPFGNIQRTYLAKDKYTQASKGFAFINYHRREDAEKCIEKLNGYGYDNLILHVEWAKPSTDKPEGDRPLKPLIGSVAAR